MSKKITKPYFKGIKSTVKHCKCMYSKSIPFKGKIKHD